MNNLFSIFDPNALGSLPLNWLAFLLMGFLVPILFWTGTNQYSLFLSMALMYVHSEFLAIFAPLAIPGITYSSMALFLMISINNALGLLPYVFTSTSHLVLTVSLALPLWLGHMLFSSISTPQSVLAHLVPLGTPMALMPFMVVIELTSNLIRPITLSVRLAANMVAGHLLLTLLSGQAPFSGLSVMVPILVTLVLLAILESAVALIQAYVFSVLSSLYLNEVSSSSFF